VVGIAQTSFAADGAIRIENTEVPSDTGRFRQRAPSFAPEAAQDLDRTARCLESEVTRLVELRERDIHSMFTSGLPRPEAGRHPQGDRVAAMVDLVSGAELVAEPSNRAFGYRKVDDMLSRLAELTGPIAMHLDHVSLSQRSNAGNSPPNRADRNGGICRPYLEDNVAVRSRFIGEQRLGRSEKRQ
jgi:hypothetical protein